MKTTKKVALLVICAFLLVFGSVMGTLAYLQMTTQTVTNTFTVGKVAITLQETYVDADGNTQTTTAGYDKFKLIPGTTIQKNPVVTVVAGSEKCYLFVKVENGLADIEDESNTIKNQMQTNGWTQLNDGSDIWYQVVETSATNVAKHVFASVKISSNVTQDGANGTKDIDNYADETIKVTAYAVQAAGFDTAAAAWDAANFS